MFFSRRTSEFSERAPLICTARLPITLSQDMNVCLYWNGGTAPMRNTCGTYLAIGQIVPRNAEC